MLTADTPTILVLFSNVAPEVQEGSAVTPGADWWSFGAILYEMVCGVVPFYHQNKKQMLILKNSTEPLIFPGNFSISDNLKDLLRSLLHPKPRSRLGWKGGFNEVSMHPWFTGSLSNSSTIAWDELALPENRALWEHPSDDFISKLQDREEEMICNR